MSSAHHWEGRRRQWAIDKKAYLQQDEPIKRNQSNLSDQLKTCKDIPQLETSSRTLNPNFKPIRRYTVSSLTESPRTIINNGEGWIGHQNLILKNLPFN